MKLVGLHVYEDLSPEIEFFPKKVDQVLYLLSDSDTIRSEQKKVYFQRLFICRIFELGRFIKLPKEVQNFQIFHICNICRGL